MPNELCKECRTVLIGIDEIREANRDLRRRVGDAEQLLLEARPVLPCQHGTWRLQAAVDAHIEKYGLRLREESE